MTAYWCLPCSLTHFRRNMNISSISYFSKSTEINTKYSALWDTLGMMLFTRNHIKLKLKKKSIGRSAEKFDLIWLSYRLVKAESRTLHCRFRVYASFRLTSYLSKLFTALIWHFIKISLNKMCWLLRGKVGYSTSRELRMQRFYLKFSHILHVTHLHFQFFYWWALKINQSLEIAFPSW